MIGKVFGRSDAFIGLERVGGIMIFDVTNPFQPALVDYINNHAIGGPLATGDVAPEGLLFVKARTVRAARRC